MQKNILKKIATVLVAFLIFFSTLNISAKEKETTKEYQGTISKEKLKEVLKDNEYALYDEETDTTTIINKDDELPKMITRSAKSQVLSGKELSKGTSFHWGADSSYYWEDIHISEYSVNGEIGYCLEPSVIDVATNNANGTGLNNIKSLRIMDDGSYNFIPTSDQIKKIKLIANYGYQYPGHQTIKYRWATQMLIWETIGWVFDDYGSLGKCGAERNEIMNLVSTHEEKPNWNNQTKNVKIGDTLDLNDPKLNKFNVHKTTIGIQILKKEANNLKIKILSKDAKLILEKPRGVDIGTSFIYSDGSTQSVANFKLQDPAKAILNFNVQSEGTLKIAKVDTKGNKVPNVKFKVWYSSNPDKTWEYITDESGETRVSTWQANKELSIQEIEVPNHLVLDPTIKKVTLKVNETSTVTFTNDIKSSLRIYKTDINTGKPIPNTVFNLLDFNKELIKTVTTDDKGIAEVLNINEGKYYIEEISVPDPYVINPDNKILEIEIKNNHNSFYEVKFLNDIKRVDFVLHKQGKENKQLLNGAIYEFSTVNKEGVKTSLGRFITGGLIITSDSDITLYKDEALTDKAGTYKPVNNEVIIEDLKPGNYYTEINNKTIKYTVIKGGISLNALVEGSKLFYKEIQAPIGYILDTKEYEANLIGEHNELISNYRTNDIIGLPSAGETNLPILTLVSIITATMFAVVGIAYYLVSKDKK